MWNWTSTGVLPMDNVLHLAIDKPSLYSSAHWVIRSRAYCSFVTSSAPAICYFYFFLIFHSHFPLKPVQDQDGVQRHLLTTKCSHAWAFNPIYYCYIVVGNVKSQIGWNRLIRPAIYVVVDWKVSVNFFFATTLANLHQFQHTSLYSERAVWR